MTAYYNDIDPYCCKVLRKQVAAGMLPSGDVDERDIITVKGEDLAGYRQIHLFAGIGGIPLGLRLAGIPDDFSICTGGFPCQDISNAGPRTGIDGPRSGLWSEMSRIIRQVRPRFVLVENSAALLIRGMGRILGDLAESGYDAEWDCIPAAALGAPHIRDRAFILAYPYGQRPPLRGSSPDVAGEGLNRGVGGRGRGRDLGQEHLGGPREAQTVLPHPKSRRAGQLRWVERAGSREEAWGLPWAEGESRIPRVADGVPNRVERNTALGNAVVVPVIKWLGQCILESVRANS